jgi:hypothetical protein
MDRAQITCKQVRNLARGPGSCCVNASWQGFSCFEVVPGFIEVTNPLHGRIFSCRVNIACFLVCAAMQKFSYFMC